MTKLAVNGAAGRMGHTIIHEAQERDDCEVVVGFDVANVHELYGVPIVDPDDVPEALEEHEPDVVIDFSVPESTMALAADCATAGVAVVIGTTGFSDSEMEIVERSADHVPLLKATNFSRGIQVLLRTVREAVGALPDYDLELMETHHNEKVDAPSGTANTILETVQEERDVKPVYGREGNAPRSDDEIGVFARRAGDVRGEHELVLAGNDEVLSLSHHAEDRAVFAAGAIDAAVWLAGQNPGRYSFGEVIDDT